MSVLRMAITVPIQREETMNEQPAPYFTRPPYHTPHGTEEREVFLPAIGDPGDETTTRLGYTADEVEEVWHGEYQLKPGVVARAVGMAPTQAEMAQAIREWVAAEYEWRHEPVRSRRYLASCEHLRALAARLPGERG